MKKIVAIMVIVSAFNAFAGDVVMLVNGKKFEGNVVKIKECQVDFKIDNVKYTVLPPLFRRHYYRPLLSKQYKFLLVKFYMVV